MVRIAAIDGAGTVIAGAIMVACLVSIVFLHDGITLGFTLRVCTAAGDGVSSSGTSACARRAGGGARA